MFNSSPVYSPMSGELETYSRKKKQSNTGSLGNRMAGNEELNKFLNRETQTNFTNYTPGAGLGSGRSSDNSSSPSNPSPNNPTQSNLLPSNTDNSTNGMAGYVAKKPEVWAPDKSEYKGFTGGVPGVDSPDPNYGQIIVSPSGTKTQYGEDGSMKTWGTDEALASAVQSKADQKSSVTNRKIDYNTNLPSDFDPGGKDAYAHNMYLYELTGIESFREMAQGMKNL